MGRRTRRVAVVGVVVAAVLAEAASSGGAIGAGELVVSDFFGGAIARVDTGSGTVGPAVQVGQGVIDIAITPDGATAYAVSALNNAVVPVDLETSAVAAAIPITCATNMAIVPSGEKAYVTQSCGTTVTPIDLTAKTAGMPIEVGPRPYGIAVAPGGSTLYVATGDLDTPDALVPIDVGSDTAAAPVTLGETGGKPGSVVITPDGTTAFVALEGNDSVIPVDLVTGTADTPVAVSTNPVDLALTPDGTKLFVTHFQRSPSGLGDPVPHDVTPIDVTTRTALPQIVVGSQTDAVAMSADGATAYVSLVGADDPSEGSIVPIDVETLTAGTPITVPGEPTALAIRPSGEDTSAPILAPTVTGSGPQSSVLLHDAAAVGQPNADDGDGSGVAAASCDAPDVSTVGPHTINCSATDVAGNTGTAQATYVVEYALVGLEPADGATAQAGHPVKVGVSLTDANGSPESLCDGCTIEFQAFAVEGTGLDDGPFPMRSHRGSGEYRYTWKPSASALGTARVTVSVGYPGTAVVTTVSGLVTIT